MAIEIIPRQTEKSPLWISILFYLFIILLIGTVASNFALDYLQKKSKKQLDDLEVSLKISQTSEQIALKEKLSNYEKKINDFSFFSDLHQSILPLFPFIEKITHPKVFISSIDFNSSENKVNLTCQTESFQTLGEQIFILKREKLIKEVNLVAISIGKDGKIAFNVILTIDPQLLKSR